LKWCPLQLPVRQGKWDGVDPGCLRVAYKEDVPGSGRIYGPEDGSSVLLVNYPGLAVFVDLKAGAGLAKRNEKKRVAVWKKLRRVEKTNPHVLTPQDQLWVSTGCLYSIDSSGK
jgi:hypothetical protein